MPLQTRESIKELRESQQALGVVEVLYNLQLADARLKEEIVAGFDPAYPAYRATPDTVRLDVVSQAWNQLFINPE